MKQRDNRGVVTVRCRTGSSEMIEAYEATR